MRVQGRRRRILVPSFFLSFFFFEFYLFIHDREREKERDREAEGEAGSMQGPRHATRFQVPRTTSRAEGGAKPLGHQGLVPSFYSIYRSDCTNLSHAAPQFPKEMKTTELNLTWIITRSLHLWGCSVDAAGGGAHDEKRDVLSAVGGGQ